jgi:hypothetical protein
LHQKLGNPRIVSTACFSALLKLTSFKDNDYDSLKSFSLTLHSVVATLLLGSYELELHSSTTLAELVGKLPPILRSKWAKKSYRIQDRLPMILDLDGWLDDVAIWRNISSMLASTLLPSFPLAITQKPTTTRKESRSQHQWYFPPR